MAVIKCRDQPEKAELIAVENGVNRIEGGVRRACRSGSNGIGTFRRIAGAIRDRAQDLIPAGRCRQPGADLTRRHAIQFFVLDRYF